FFNDIEDKDKPDGEIFRKDIIYVAGGGKRVHQGNPNEPAIREDLEKLLIFMNSDIPILIKALITHYFFEYVHPFYDGNGRTGRFLLSSYLARKLDLFTGLSVSEAVLQNKKKYEDSFSNTSHPKNRGEITSFVGDMLEIILKGQERMLAKVNKLKNQIEQLSNLINLLEVSEVEAEILYILGQDQLFEIVDEGVSNIKLSE
ncbi:Fic family protein, partial [Streptococcus danieliae]|nr:Fic family protein [Streptococcus danieliae]